MSTRPPFIDEILLARPLPPLVPKGLSPTQNPVYSEEARSKIADLKCHPALESAVRLASAAFGSFEPIFLGDLHSDHHSIPIVHDYLSLSLFLLLHTSHHAIRPDVLSHSQTLFNGSCTL